MTTLKLSTYTPLAVGAGDTLSPYSDYLLDPDANKIHLLDKERIRENLSNNPDLIDEYVEGITIGNYNNRSRFNLKHFIEDRLRCKIDDVTKFTYPLSESAVHVVNKKQINTIIKRAGINPYIPGSTLKGALKTALLYYWLTQEEKGKQWLSQYLTNLNSHGKRKQYENELDTQLNNYTQLLKGKRFGITDSEPLNPKTIKIYHTHRLHLKNQKNQSIPQVWETIDLNKEATCELQPGSLELSFIKKSVGHFSFEANDRMFEMLDKLGDYIDPATYDKLFVHYEAINGMLKAGKVLIRLGFGKGYFFNSVGLAIYKYGNKNHFANFLKIQGQNKFKNAEQFPITQLIETSECMPLGWVKIENL